MPEVTLDPKKMKQKRTAFGSKAIPVGLFLHVLSPNILLNNSTRFWNNHYLVQSTRCGPTNFDKGGNVEVGQTYRERSGKSY
jgi:hypothetical protein